MNFTNFNIGKRAANLETSDVFDAYGRVDVVLGEDDEGNVITISYPNIADDRVSGRILTVEMPMCTNTALALTAAQRIYNSLTSKNETSFQYTPMVVDGALADPSMEFGDSVDVNGVHGGFYKRDVTFSKLMQADLSAPTDEEVDHEYPYQDSQQRQITRTNKELKSGLYVTNQAITAEVAARQSADTEIRATLTVHSNQISARVTKTGGSSSSFGWVLNDTSHTWYAGNQEVMRVNSSGLYVKGEIRATSGVIGGFTIGSSSIYSNGMSSMSSSQSTGVHVGTDGIKLGQNFKVDTSGNLTANRGTFGSLNVSSGGTSYSGRLSGCGGSVSSGLSYGGGSYGSLGSLDSNLKSVSVKVGTLEATSITTSNLVSKIQNAGTIYVSTLQLNGQTVVLHTEAWYDQEGNFHRIYYWGI